MGKIKVAVVTGQGMLILHHALLAFRKNATWSK
jgi:hypothetical protein